MGRGYSDDLRVRVIDAVERGASRRGAARVGEGHMYTLKSTPGETRMYTDADGL
jgi:hypothetical protein